MLQPMNDIAEYVDIHKGVNIPIVHSLLDTDLYKLTMAQLIFYRCPGVKTTFETINRSQHVVLSKTINEVWLREQLDHVRSLRFTGEEIDWLRTIKRIGNETIFHTEFLEWLKTFQLPGYSISNKNGCLTVRFSGPWVETTFWEIPILTILNELHTRALIEKLSYTQLKLMYRRAEERLLRKLDRLRKIEGLALADFGTRRRHSQLWQKNCVAHLIERLGEACIGTSNCAFSKCFGTHAVGTQAHELTMVYTALEEDDHLKRLAPYKVLEDWAKLYPIPMQYILPDTYGIESFLHYTPEWITDWPGARMDSSDPISAGERMLAWWKDRQCDLKHKTLLFSDQLDVDTIETLGQHFRGRVRVCFGWGTRLTNDFVGLMDQNAFEPLSIVCKVIEANGFGVVKLSDDPAKESGPKKQINRYKKIFALAG